MTRTRRPVRTVIALSALVLSLGGWGWLASEQGREGWWAFGQHAAVTPGDQGWADLGTLSVRVAGSETLLEVDEVQPPAGFTFLALDLEVRAEEAGEEAAEETAEEASELSSCEVQVRDSRGRLFLAGQEVPRDDAYVTSLTCGTSDPQEEPVPATQSLLVLVPLEAELISVRVDAREFPPARFIELPLRS